MNERLAYIKSLEAQIGEAQATLDRLKAERDRAIEQAQHQEIERLEEHLASARVRLKDIREAAEEAWQDLRAGTEELLHNISESLKKLL